MFVTAYETMQFCNLKDNNNMTS